MDENSSPVKKALPPGTETVASILGPCFQEKPRILELLCDLSYITNYTIEGSELKDTYMPSLEDQWFSQVSERPDQAGQVEEDETLEIPRFDQVSVAENEEDEETEKKQQQ
jgi:hypothetical protein